MKTLKTFMVLFLLVTFGAIHAQTSSSVADALVASKEQNKKIFVELYTDWCPHCKKFEKKTIPNEMVKKELMNFVYVKINPEKNMDQFAKANDKKKYPQFFLLNEKGEILKSDYGFMKPEELLEFLTQ